MDSVRYGAMLSVEMMTHLCDFVTQIMSLTALGNNTMTDQVNSATLSISLTDDVILYCL